MSSQHVEGIGPGMTRHDEHSKNSSGESTNIDASPWLRKKSIESKIGIGGDSIAGELAPGI